MLNQPSVGIILRLCFCHLELHRSLENIREQSYHNWKIYLVDIENSLLNSCCELIEDIRDKVVVISANDENDDELYNTLINTVDTELAILHERNGSWVPDYLSITTQVYQEKSKLLTSVRGVVSLSNAVFETVNGYHVEVKKLENWQIISNNLLSEGVVPLDKMLVRDQFPSNAFLFNWLDSRELIKCIFSDRPDNCWGFHSLFLLNYDIWVHPEYLAFQHIQVSEDDSVEEVIAEQFFMGREQLSQNKLIRTMYEHDNSSLYLIGKLCNMQERIDCMDKRNSDGLFKINRHRKNLKI